MIISYPPTMRRQLLSKHFLISTMPERALDDLVKFSTVVRFEPHRRCLQQRRAWRLPLRHPIGSSADLLHLSRGERDHAQHVGNWRAFWRDRDSRRTHANGERRGDGACGPSPHSPRPFPTLCEGQSGLDSGHAVATLRPATVDKLDNRGRGFSLLSGTDCKAAVIPWRAIMADQRRATSPSQYRSRISETWSAPAGRRSTNSSPSGAPAGFLIPGTARS